MTVCELQLYVYRSGGEAYGVNFGIKLLISWQLLW
jgi:hypothetical protein